MIELKGISWDHPRGYEPLIAASNEFTKENSKVSIFWDVRSLKEFGDMPIENLIESYDLITIDHPYMGQADNKGLLVNLEEYISKDRLGVLQEQSLGDCFNSYEYNGHLYALPIDAAAQVAAYRKDIIWELGLNLPSTYKDLKTFYGKVPNGFSVAWALCPTDLWCSFLTLCAQNRGAGFIENRVFNKEVGSMVLDEIKYHLEFLHPESIHWNPIQVLDKMGNGEDLLYCPYLFGYSNYSREGYTKNVVHFTDSPFGEQKNISTLLGGVGLAVSSKSNYPDIATNFVEFVAGSEIQEGVFTLNGGQPGNLIAWQNENNNALCNNFFKDTLSTIEKAYVRPKHPGWNEFQDQGCFLLHEGILKNRPSHKIMNDLNELYKSIYCL
ncbi:extracellular solute-binding protein [Arenibacter troitsensis]|uniref:Multiple sugar transport system substrate-binding protein n=1 Tax=Arenibacter troitsensis TaxID=188872 RepID=A0A1X7KJN0_9FLAO|nr:extracellular solute-binding protein [Arenibacter troitsensis]SMG41283.1 multiple sugar transport system substrate-binding protein [Arenibacter troitsensis]